MSASSVLPQQVHDVVAELGAYSAKLEGTTHFAPDPTIKVAVSSCSANNIAVTKQQLHVCLFLMHMLTHYSALEGNHDLPGRDVIWSNIMRHLHSLRACYVGMTGCELLRVGGAAFKITVGMRKLRNWAAPGM